LAGLAIDGLQLAGVSVEVELLDPRTGAPAGDGFSVEGAWQSEGDRLLLDGAVRAEGTDDRVADLVVRVGGVELPLSTMAEDPLLLPKKLLSKLPLVSLRAGGQDRLSLAVPPDKLAVFDFRQEGDAVELRYRFGFTAEAKPSLRRRAPFTCVLYRTDPRWHFRSALARYYEFFPKPFEPFAREQGGWFFAAPTEDLPNPQHFFYHEGGPAGWQEDEARGMGTYPYQESSSYTVGLPGDQLPKSHDEAMARFAELEEQVTPAGWGPQQSFVLDGALSHSGKRSLLADSGDSRNWTGGRQSVMLDPPVTEPLVIRGFSRAEGVGGERNSDYSIYVDVCYASGAYLFGQCATFATGSHDWKQTELVVKPTEPVAELRVYCLLRSHTGKAWFDDLHVGPAADPKVNWVVNPGFEEGEHRKDLQFIRDNVCVDSRGEHVVYITDNVGADVRPETPMNLLRFTLNVDPDVPDSEEHPAVAARQFRYYDDVFESNPGVDGCYIDSVSAWCSRVLNCRREHWPYNDAPFTYDPTTFQVAAHGRFAMQDFLGALQTRYHPKGKAVFTNIHVDLDAFPLYLVSDVPGIESSLFQDQDSLFFYRASSYRKPLLLLNFMNLHGLDNRATGETYHLNAAQWGEFPSTGRFVQEAYRGYGDVTHAYLPAIKELSAAGWQPIPLAEGARVERYGAEGAVYFTVRPTKPAAEETLLIAPEALAALGTELVAFDAVWLNELPLEKRGNDWAIRFAHGADELHLVRIASRPTIPTWLLERARSHAASASRVRGEQSRTPELLAAIESLSQPQAPTAGALLPQLATCRDKLDGALASITGAADDLFLLSQRREILQARQAVSALAAFAMGARLDLAGRKVGYPGQTLALTAEGQAPSGVEIRLVTFDSAPGRVLVPSLELGSRSGPAAGASLRLESKAPQDYHVRGVFAVTKPGQEPWVVERAANAFFAPAASLTLTAGPMTEPTRRYTVTIGRQPGVGEVVLRPQVSPAAATEPESLVVPADRTTAEFRVARVLDGASRVVTVAAQDGNGNELARTEATYWDEPGAPADNLALAARGARCRTDSAYSGYSPEPLVDGVTATSGLHWTKIAWASQDNGEPHWVQLDLPAATKVSEVRIYWSVDAERLYTSSRYAIVGLVDGGRRVLLDVDAQTERAVSIHKVGPVVVQGIRIEQPEDGGPKHRAGIMWIREVCLLP
jgi:hypothetical protein